MGGWVGGWVLLLSCEEREGEEEEEEEEHFLMLGRLANMDSGEATEKGALALTLATGEL